MKNESFDPEDVFASAYVRGGGRRSFYVSENALIYVAAGRLEVLVDGERVATFGRGECLFVRKDHGITLVNEPTEGVDYHLSVFLFFRRRELLDYYRTLHDTDLPRSVERSHRCYLSIPRSSLLTSLFESFRPYWTTGERPEAHWLRMKVLEAIRLLLLQDASVYASLFDFAGQWRRDIMEFMEENYRYDLSVSDMARYTGRSLSTFKRDFARLSDLSPAGWVMDRRLRQARHLLESTDWPVFKVMTAVGFRNFSHFSRRYKARFGHTPRQTR